MLPPTISGPLSGSEPADGALISMKASKSSKLNVQEAAKPDDLSAALCETLGICGITSAISGGARSARRLLIATYTRQFLSLQAA